MSIYTLDEDITMDGMIKVLTDIDHRTDWDSGLIQAKILRRFSDCFIMFRTVVHMPIIQNRDFIEKMIVFQYEGSYYIYYSSVPDSYYEKTSDETRGYTMYAVNRISKIGRRIVVRTSTQKDPQASVTGFMSVGMIGGKSAENITKFRLKLMERIRRTAKNE